jgi:general secretion pathway protein L
MAGAGHGTRRMRDRVRTFLRWWVGELEGLIPARFQPRRNEAIALWQDDRLSFWRRANAGMQPMTPADAAAESLSLRLTGVKFWHRDFTFPRAARPFLRQIFTNEMDRRSPWRAEAVYFRCEAENAGPDLLTARLVLVPRQTVQPALAALAQLGMNADRLELTDDPDPANPSSAVGLTDGAPIMASSDASLLPAMALLALAALALISILVQGAWVIALSAQTVSARQEANMTRQLAADIARIERRRHFPSQVKERLPSAIGSLDALARALPDDAYVEDIAIADGHIVIAGVARDAAPLLARIDGAEPFANAAFRAPITAAENGLQRFQLSADLREVPHAAP